MDYFGKRIFIGKKQQPKYITEIVIAESGQTIIATSIPFRIPSGRGVFIKIPKINALIRNSPAADAPSSSRGSVPTNNLESVKTK